MQRVFLLIALLLRNTLVDLAQVDVATRLLLTLGTLRSDFVQLLSVVTSAFEPAYVIEVARQLAELRGTTPEEIGVQTSQNFRRFFSLPA